ncbi:hypothetical protein Tco_0518376, partial [Tanacetum coccineum]
MMFTRHENKGKYFRGRGRGRHNQMCVYIAASEAAMEAVWIRKFISGF